jgi:putative membrane protein
MSSVKSAATTLANNAGAKGAVTALQGVKSQVAQSFTSKDLKALKSGAQELADGTEKLESGANQLADGAKTLQEGMNQFDEEGIQKLVSLYNDDVSGLMDRFEAVQNAGKNYQTYTGLADGTKGSVRFIYKAGKISSDDEE